MTDLLLHPIDTGFDLRRTRHVVQVPAEARTADVADKEGNHVLVAAPDCEGLVRKLRHRGYRAESAGE